MTTREFARWLGILRTHFPSSRKLRQLGVEWYPGEAGDEQRMKLLYMREIGRVHSYRLFLTDVDPDAERVRIAVQLVSARRGEVDFWFGAEVELAESYYGFEATEIEAVRALLAEIASDIVRVWQEYLNEAKKGREKWKELLEPGPTKHVPRATRDHKKATSSR